MEDYGYLMERIILFATDLGLGTCWLGGSFTKSSFAKKISARSDELVPAVTSVGHIADRPRRIDALIRRGAGSDKRLPWSRLFFDGSFETPLAPEAAGDYALPLEMVRLGPSASNKQPWRIVRDGTRWHFFLQRTSGYNEGRGRRMWAAADMQRLDMGIAMCHFELTARELGLEGGWVQDEPAIALGDDLTEYTVSWHV
jgi:nitroreductase